MRSSSQKSGGVGEKGRRAKRTGGVAFKEAGSEARGKLRETWRCLGVGYLEEAEDQVFWE